MGISTTSYTSKLLFLESIKNIRIYMYATEAVHCRLHTPRQSNMDTSAKSTHLVVFDQYFTSFYMCGFTTFPAKTITFNEFSTMKNANGLLAYILGIICRSDITPPEKIELIIARPLSHRQQLLVDGLCIFWITCPLVWKNVQKNKHEIK